MVRRQAAGSRRMHLALLDPVDCVGHPAAKRAFCSQSSTLSRRA